jgi:hypothetical protein
MFMARFFVIHNPNPRAEKSMARVTTKATIRIRATKKALMAPANIPISTAAEKAYPDGLAIVDHLSCHRYCYKHHAAHAEVHACCEQDKGHADFHYRCATGLHADVKQILPLKKTLRCNPHKQENQREKNKRCVV